MSPTLNDLTAYRENPREQRRISDIVSRLPKGFHSVLDIGTRDGYIAELLTKEFGEVWALDLQKPKLNNKEIIAVQGDVTDLQFDNQSHDVVLCCEVLEHIPTCKLERACAEISRVAKHAVLIGVPYRQDLRIGRTQCRECNSYNPPYGHVNSFDEKTLQRLFSGLTIKSIGYVETRYEVTSWLATKFYDLSGNPFGSYGQHEPCLNCGAFLLSPRAPSIPKRVLAKAANTLNRIQSSLSKPCSEWLHVLFEVNG